MSMIETLTPVKRPPEIAVAEVQFARLGMIKIVDRAIKAHGPVVTLCLPGGKRMTVLARASHAAFWQANEACFHKDTGQRDSGVSLTRNVLGRTLLTASDGDEWQKMRREMTQILGASKTWFQRPLADATQGLVRDLQDRPDVPLLEHCITWATRAICEPLIGAQALDAAARDLVDKLNASFLALLSDPAARMSEDMRCHYDAVMRRVAAECGADSVAGQMVRHAGSAASQADVTDILRASVGGMLAASLHINALSLFWALVQLADDPELQDALGVEAAPWKMSPRRVVDTPLAFATVREAQRLRPVMAFVERQVKSAVVIDGFTLEAGDTVLFSPWFAQRDDAVWHDPMRFDPARFVSTRLAPGSYFPFGIGRRICPGTNLVNQQLTFALSGIAQTLRLSLPQDTRPGDLAPMFRINLEPRGPVTLRAVPVPQA